MAGTCLSSQLASKLDDSRVSLSERLEVAYKVFSSSEIPILQKEEYVLSWITKTLTQTSSFQDKELLFSFLLKCLQCNTFRHFNGNMKTAVISDLLMVLKLGKKYPKNIQLLIRRCSAEIIKIPFFQRWFMCDPERLCKIAAVYFKSIFSFDDASDFTNVLDIFLFIHKMSLLKDELRVRFMKDVIKPMCEALSHILSSERRMFFEKAMCCCRDVLFYEPKFLDNYILANKSKDEESSDEVKSFGKKIRHLPTKEKKEIVEICYTLFLRSVISKYPDEYEKIFRVFISLCPPLGIVVNGIVSIEMNPVVNWEITDSFEIMERLIDILDDSKIPLTCQLEEVTLQNWFASLVIGLSSINSRNFSCSFFKMIKRVYEFNPLVIEPSCKVITMIMLQTKNPYVRPSYIELLRSILDGSSKLQRLQKFIAFFLDNTHDYLMTSPCEDNLLLEDVLPSAVCEHFRSAFSTLPPIQILGIMRSFIFHLQRHCLNELSSDSGSDKVTIINYGIICELFTILISNESIVDYSVPESVKEKFKLMLEDLQVLLKVMGNSLKDFHEDGLLKPYLKLCKAFGEMKLLFREYDNIAIVAPMDIDLEPTNISYVHNYLDPDSWKRIALSIEQHTYCQAADHFYELLIQKIGAISQVEEGLEGPGTHVARYLLTSADTEWLWEKILILAPLFHSAELTKLISKVVRYLGTDQSAWLPLLKEEALTENRRLVLGLGMCLMYKASRKLESEETVSRQVISLSSPVSLLDFELSQLILDDEELKEAVVECQAEMAAILNENLPLLNTPSTKTPPLSHLEVSARLPLQYLSALSQSVVLLSAIALLYDLPPGSPADMLLFNLILKILDGPQKGSDLLSDLNLDSFLKFVARRGKDYRGQRKLMKRICAVAFRSKKSSKQLFREVDKPSISEAWITAVVIDCLAQLKKKFIGSKESQKPLERRKCFDQLMGSVVPLLCSEPPSPSHLYTFTVIYSHTLRYLSTNQECFAQLSPLLGQYISFALLDYTEGERLVECLIEHRSDLGEYFPPTLITSTFEQMKVQVVPPTDSTAHFLFGASTPKEFKTLLKQLVSETTCEDLEVEGMRSIRLLLLWSQLLSGFLSNEKSRDREEALSHLLEVLLTTSQRWSSGSTLYLVQPTLSIISTISKNTGVSLRGVVIDSLLGLCGVVPLVEEEQLLTNLGPLLDSLLTLYRYRTTLLADRLPAFLQRYRRCLLVLPSVATPSTPYTILKRALPIANKMERLATTMVKRAKDFSRLAAYLIADLLTVYQHHNLASEVKFVYDNMINAFLSISDKHAVSFLKGILPTGQQEIFNSIYENYNKFHRFVGKI